MGAVSLLLGVVVLIVNFTNEYSALNGKTPWTRLPSYDSAQRRMGMDQRMNDLLQDQLAWEPFLEEQFRRLGRMFLPYCVLGTVEEMDDKGKPRDRGDMVVIIGLAGFGACLIGLTWVRQKILWTSLLLSGFCWSLPMRHDTAFHDYEGLFYIGIPLAFFSFVLGGMRQLFGTVFIAGLAVTAMLGFVLSSFQMSRAEYDAESVELLEKAMADFDVISRLTKGKRVLNSSRGLSHRNLKEERRRMEYYLAGASLHHYHHPSSRVNKRDLTDFDVVVTYLRVEGANLLTPENRQVFLYERDDDFFDAYRSRSFGRLLARSNFDIYFDGTVLRYVKNPCSHEDRNAAFFLHIIPVDVEDLPDYSRQYGFENRDFSFGHYRQDLSIDSMCEAVVPLPDYAIARIETGQYIPHEGTIWEEMFSSAGKNPLR